MFEVNSENFFELGGLKGVTDIIEEKLADANDGKRPLVVKYSSNIKDLGEYKDCYCIEDFNSIYIKGSKGIENLNITEIEQIQIFESFIFIQFNKYQNSSTMSISYKN